MTRKKAVLFAAGTIAIIVLMTMAVWPRSDASSAVVFVRGERYKVVDLQNRGYQEIFIEADLSVLLAAENGSIWFASSDCPDKICIGAGKLHEAHQAAACLPAQVSVILE